MSVSKQTNGIDAEAAEAYVKRILNLQADIDSERGKFMSYAKDRRDDIKEVMAEAKDAHGIPIKSIKSIVKLHALREKERKLEAGLAEGEDIPYEQMREKLGLLVGTPLGDAALDQAA